MRLVSALFGIFFLLLGSANAQADKNTRCPTISAIAPPGLLVPGSPIKYTADIKGDIPSSSILRWSIDKGEILEGQGTTTLVVVDRNPAAGEINITATLEVIGLPEGCSNTVAVTYNVMFCFPPPTIFDDFAVKGATLDKARLDRLINFLSESPNSTAYIIQYFPQNFTKKRIDSRVKQTSEYLRNSRLIPAENFTILAAQGTQTRTKFYIVPAGATPPRP